MMNDQGGKLTKHIINPNLPEGPVKLAIVDGRIGIAAEKNLKSLGMELLKMKRHQGLYDAVCSHPDMLLHHIGARTLVFAPGVDPALINELKVYGFSLLKGERKLSPSYPLDIAYNVARVGKRYFHNLKYTDPVIAGQLDRMGIKAVHVEQGYAKCSILPVDENSIITSDAGIAKAAEKEGLDVLLADFGGSIKLPGLNYGFIGGAGGMISEKICAINGKINDLNCFEIVSAFLARKKIHFLGLSEEPVTDIGSILPLIS